MSGLELPESVTRRWVQCPGCSTPTGGECRVCFEGRGKVPAGFAVEYTLLELGGSEWGAKWLQALTDLRARHGLQEDTVMIRWLNN